MDRLLDQVIDAVEEAWDTQSILYMDMDYLLMSINEDDLVGDYVKAINPQEFKNIEEFKKEIISNM